MALHPEGIFTSGPLFQLVGLAAGPGDALEWEVLRLNRILLTEHWDPHWRHPLQPLASQLDYMAVTFTDAFFDSCPPAARAVWTAAAGDRTVPEFMTELALLLRLADREGEPDYDAVPLAGWEAEARFPLLRDLDLWAYLDEHASFDSAFRERIDGEHPWCDRELVPIVTQAVQALALCARSAAFATAFRAYAPAATTATLEIVVELGQAHMAEHHRTRPA
ncbi:hypothetical protein AMK26_07845 [Streptomyces sp. CB03234]|uniref:hypothetical protein n=1 Tax=Streptomyces sp. (strain CB03234) TaxID=1703937 RepID=UPI00093E908A|nr:hypothetical protein [Streptomyces sp. CB03234]OKK05996.1 hypothetical protein AMK26_07845 [Streptomyces sp. CB03234]